jgi:hypothetical protein
LMKDKETFWSLIYERRPVHCYERMPKSFKKRCVICPDKFLNKTKNENYF